MNLVPGGPFLSEKAITPQAQHAMEQKYGMDKPLFTQYTTYMSGLVKGDFGLSIKKRGRTVADIIKERFPISARLALIAIVFASIIGVTLGALSAFHKGGALDQMIILFSTAGIAVPTFLSSTLLLYIFSTKLNILPSLGLNDWRSYIMPCISLALYPASYISRLTRSSMLDVLSQDYIRTARAKGLNEFKVVFKHALRNAILPVVTYVGPLLAMLMTGSFIVEKIFTIPGLGAEFVGAITSRDYPMIMGTTIFLATLVIVMNFIVDVVYAIIDPRIKLK